MDQDRAFMSSFMTYLLDKFNIKIKTVAPYNHQSLQAEHDIKLLSNIQASYQFRSDVAEVPAIGNTCM